MRRVIVVVLLFTLAAPTWAGLDEGMAAYERGDYATAVPEFRTLAARGHTWAQVKLGLMYANGRGVRQDYSEAMRWYRKAAEQGDARGQYSLGFMYREGQGVPKDCVQAHKWFNLAASRGDANATENRDYVAERMTRAQIAKAQRSARAWQLKRRAAVSSPSAPDAALARKRIARIQRGLASLRYDPGPADGILGPKTRASIRAFEAREGLPVTGTMSKRLEDALWSASRSRRRPGISTRVN